MANGNGHGGVREGAGRPKKYGDLTAEEALALNVEDLADIREAAKHALLTPIAYAIGVINSTTANPDRRDAMARAVMAYFHNRKGTTRPDKGKKEGRAEAAIVAARGKFETPEGPSGVEQVAH